MNSQVRWIKHLLIVLFGILLGWRILVTGLADNYALQETPEAASGALRWREGQPEALYQQAETLLEREPATAERLLQAAAWADPTDARIYMALAELGGEQEGRQAAADALMGRADALGPVRTVVLARSADFWWLRHRLDRMLERWSLLLRTQPAVDDALYPELLHFAENPDQQELLQPLLENPPTWWDRFFAYAAREAQQTETVSFLYRQRQGREKEQPSAMLEQRAYLDRLWQDARWAEAYRAWQDSLDERQTQALYRIYNGGFELPVTDVGFDWRITSLRGARVETAPTYGVRGERALRVAFDGQPVRFRHVLQYLLLEPGQYRLQGRARPDNLRTALGLQWTVRCVATEGALLAESERFLGSDDWRFFSLDFTVPEAECPAQVLRLQLAGRAALDFEAEGEIWFDDLAITALQSEQ